AALVNSAPGALDTLNELAAALGNDANFAASVATAIGNARTDWGYATTIGDASATSIVVTHNLASRDVVVELYTVASPYATVMADVERTSTTTVTLTFATPPGNNQYRALVRRVA
ncbi:MAG: hypothetical protein WCG26_07100, partial [Chloroflexales bacterium]